jgi:hypothetical protein
MCFWQCQNLFYIVLCAFFLQVLFHTVLSIYLHINNLLSSTRLFELFWIRFHGKEFAPSSKSAVSRLDYLTVPCYSPNHGGVCFSVGSEHFFHCSYNAVMQSWQLAFTWEQGVNFDIRDVKARVLTDVAWVTMKAQVDMEIAGPFNVTNVYEFHGGRWYMVHHHSSVMLIHGGGEQQMVQ